MMHYAYGSHLIDWVGLLIAFGVICYLKVTEIIQRRKGRRLTQMLIRQFTE